MDQHCDRTRSTPCIRPSLVLPDLGDHDVDEDGHQCIAEDEDHCEVHDAFPFVLGVRVTLAIGKSN